MWDTVVHLQKEEMHTEIQHTTPSSGHGVISASQLYPSSSLFNGHPKANK